jgi:LysM repeat protein
MNNDDQYLMGHGPKRGCGCFIAAAVLAVLVGVGIYFFFIREKSDSPPEPPPVEAGETPGTEPDGTPGEGTGTSTEPPDAGTLAMSEEDALDLLAKARQAVEDKKLAAARKLGFRVLQTNASDSTIRGAQDMLSDIHSLLAFSKLPMKEKIRYTIQRGDTLGEIAKKHKTNVELIMKGNNLPNDRIRIGDNLLILSGNFYVEVSKTKNVLLVFMNDEFFKRYDVGTGEYASTPVGEFKINDRIEHPTWFPPSGPSIPYGHKNNLLGTHWLSINVRGYGIHGTWDNSTSSRSGRSTWLSTLCTLGKRMPAKI